jgi:hypothetical protein
VSVRASNFWKPSEPRHDGASIPRSRTPLVQRTTLQFHASSTLPLLKHRAYSDGNPKRQRIFHGRSCSHSIGIGSEFSVICSGVKCSLPAQDFDSSHLFISQPLLRRLCVQHHNSKSRLQLDLDSYFLHYGYRAHDFHGSNLYRHHISSSNWIMGQFLQTLSHGTRCQASQRTVAWLLYFRRHHLRRRRQREQSQTNGRFEDGLHLLLLL